MGEKTVGHFAFDPALVVAQHGDTERFVQNSAAPHNVAFRNPPKGAKLGAAMTGPYVIPRGKTYDLVIDARFVNGSYAFVCDPHESVGMRGTLKVGKYAK